MLYRRRTIDCDDLIKASVLARIPAHLVATPAAVKALEDAIASELARAMEAEQARLAHHWIHCACTETPQGLLGSKS